MSINMRFAPDLVLRNYSEYLNKTKQKEECIPNNLQEEEVYSFLKLGQRAYWLDGEQPLLEKSSDGSISQPIASVIILEATHFKKDDNIWTRGTYLVKRVLHEGEIYFNGCEPIAK